MKPDKILLFGYHPLFYMPSGYTPGNTFGFSPTQTQIESIIKLIPDVEFKGVVWAAGLSEGMTDICPIFICNKAKEVAEHLKYYSSNDPSRWFKFYHCQASYRGHRGYTAVLHPDLEMAIKRFKHANAYYANLKVEVDDFTIIYKTISVDAPISDAYLKFAATKPKKVKVYAYEYEEIKSICNLSTSGSVLPSEDNNYMKGLYDITAHELGEFEVAKPTWQKIAHNYKKLIKDRLMDEFGK